MVADVENFQWNERVIATAICRQTLAKRCVVLVDNCDWTGHECDVLAVTTNLRIIDIEIKITRADLRADSSKDKWWTRYISWHQHGPLPAPNRWPRRVWKHYYAMPEKIWKPELLDELHSDASGVILLKSVQQYRNAVPIEIASVVRRAIPNPNAYRLKPEEVMDIARLATLRLWNAYETLAGRQLEVHHD